MKIFGTSVMPSQTLLISSAIRKILQDHWSSVRNIGVGGSMAVKDTWDQLYFWERSDG